MIFLKNSRRRILHLTFGLSVLISIGLYQPAYAQDATAGEQNYKAQKKSSKIKSITKQQAAELSKAQSSKIVFHYDASSHIVVTKTLEMQVQKLNSLGYASKLVDGGPKDGVQVFIDGKTMPKLIFNSDSIFEQISIRYAATVYNRLFGKPKQ